MVNMYNTVWRIAIILRRILGGKRQTAGAVVLTIKFVSNGSFNWLANDESTGLGAYAALKCVALLGDGEALANAKGALGTVGTFTVFGKSLADAAHAAYFG